MPTYPALAETVDYEALIGPVPVGVDLGLLLDAVSARVRRYCGWHIAPVVTETVTATGNDSRLLFLPTLKLVAVNSVTDDGTELDLATVGFDEVGYLERTEWNTFSSKRGAVVAEIDHGYARDDLADLTALVVTVASRDSTLPADVLRKQVGQVLEIFREPGLMQHEKDQLDAFRLPRVR